MRLLALIPAAAMTVVIVYLRILLRRLRRAGRPDTTADRVLAVQAVLVAAYTIVVLCWPSAYRWASSTLAVTSVITSFGFLACRIREYPQTVLSPSTIRRLRRCRGHR